jgi:hypothetical protein
MTAKTLKRLERAAMRYYCHVIDPSVNFVDSKISNAFFAACKHHANAQRKGAKRKGK